jgi:hypothetical protein
VTLEVARLTQQSRKFFTGRNLTFAESTGGVRQPSSVPTAWVEATGVGVRSPEANGGGASASRFAGAGCFAKRPGPEACQRPAH